LKSKKVDYCWRCGGTKQAQDGSCSEIAYTDMAHRGIPVYCMTPRSKKDNDNV